MQICVDVNATILDILDVLDDQNHLYDLLRFNGRFGNMLVFDVIQEVCLFEEIEGTT